MNNNINRDTKMFKNNLLILILILFAYCDSFGSKEIDSLKKLIVSTPEIRKPKLINELASKYWFSNPQESFRLSREALALSLKLQSDSAVASSNYTIGVTHLIINNNDSAFFYLNSSLEQFKQLNDSLKIANNLRAIADVYNSISDMENAQKYFHSAYKLFEKLKLNVDNNNVFYKLYAILLNNFGIFQLNLNNFQEAKTYFETSKTYYVKLNDMQGLSIAYYNTGICWLKLKNIDSCIENYTKAYKIAADNNILTIKSSALMSLGEIYYEEEKFSDALKYLELSLPIMIQLEDKSSTAYNYMLQSQIYFEIKQFNKSKEYLDLSVKYSKESNRIELILDSYRLYAEIYNEMNDLKKSIKYYVLHINLKDSLNKIEKTQRIAEIDKKFQFERKENENKILRYNYQVKELNNKQLRITIISLIIIISLIVITLFIIKRRAKMKEELNCLLQIKNQELEITNATKDKFFSIIAHDLKNPLGSFREVTKLLYEANADFTEDEKMEFLELMKNSSNNIYSLLENLLDWSRSQQGKISFNPQQIDLNILVEDTIQLLKLTTNKKSITIMNLMQSNNLISVDTNLIITVIRNLLSNAIKFSPIGGLIEIGEVIKPSEGFMHIFVKDKGVGMTEGTIKKLFRIDENVSSLGTAGESGTGLGLILCKEFVEKHGGKIWVESEVGVGSTFWFSLPIKQNQ